MQRLKILILSVVIGAMLAGGVTMAAVWQNTDWIIAGATISATKVKANFDYLKEQISSAGIWSVSGSDVYYNSGNVGIGTNAPSEKLYVNGNAQVTGSAIVNGNIYSANNTSHLYVAGGDSYNKGGNILMYGGAYDGGPWNGGIRFRDNNTDRMVIKGDTGKVGIGTIYPERQLHLKSPTSSWIRLQGSSGGNAGLELYRGTQREWRIYNQPSTHRLRITDQENNSGVYLAQDTGAWASGSDRRLKQNIEEFKVLNKLDDYRAVSFDWKENGKHDIGVIAQELYKIFPEAVMVGDKDGVGPLEKDKEWGVEYAKLGALALQAIKELKEENDKLKARLDALEAKLNK